MSECPYHGACQGLIRESEQLRENHRALFIEASNLKEKIVICEQSTKSAHHRLDELKDLTNAVLTIAGEVKEVSRDTKAILERMEKHEKALDTHWNKMSEQDDAINQLKNAPAKTALDYLKMFFSAAVIAVAGYVVAALMHAKF